MSNQKKPSSGKILIVDDEPDMLEMLDMIITDKTSHQVVTTNNPLEVGEILAKGNFNLVITDLKMPVMDGMDVIAAVKSLDADIPVVMITAFGTIESAEEAVRRGAYDFHHQALPERADSGNHRASPGLATTYQGESRAQTAHEKFYPDHNCPYPNFAGRLLNPRPAQTIFDTIDNGNELRNYSVGATHHRGQYLTG